MAPETAGFPTEGPTVTDAFGAVRKAKCALGPLNTDPLGICIIVR